jgi:two-component system, LytTR family, sensor kinase
MTAATAPGLSETRTLRTWRIIGWVAFVVATLFLKLGGAATSRPTNSGDDLTWMMTPILSTWVDALALYVALQLARRYPIGQSQPITHLFVHVVPASLYAAAGLAMTHWLEPGSAAAADPWSVQIAWELLDYGVFVGLAHGVEYVLRYRAGEAAELRLRMEVATAARQRAEADLRVLKMELNPKILADSLGTVSTLVREDPAAAERALADLGDGMRRTLSRATPFDDDDVDDESAPSNQSSSSSTAGVPPLLFVTLFVGLFTLSFSRAYEKPLPTGAQATLIGAFVSGITTAALVTAMLVVGVRLTTRRGSSRWRGHGVAAATFGLVNLASKLIFISLVGGPYRMITPSRMVGSVIAGAIIYLIMAVLVHAGEYARRFRGSEATALRLRTDLADLGRQRAEAALRALKAELNPHFLGNALATVSSLILTDAAAAQRVLLQLGAVLRDAIARVDTQEVSLREEINGLAPFLEVEKARFGEKLEVSWDLDQAALGARVPHMILQPLVENALKHGLSSRGGGRIVVTGRRSGANLELNVRDDGVGVAVAKKTVKAWSTGVGLANARARLDELYGGQASLDIVSGAGVGTTVRLILPWMEEQASLSKKQ